MIAHFYAAHPPPDPTPAFAIEDPAARLQAVLGGLYAWYRDGHQIIANVRRDRALVPAMDEMLSERVDTQLAALGEALVAGWSPSDDAKQRLSVTIAIAIDFWTWQRMAELGLDDAEAAELMTDIAVCVVKASTWRARQSARARPNPGESARGARRQTRG